MSSSALSLDIYMTEDFHRLLDVSTVGIIAHDRLTDGVLRVSRG